MGKFGTETIITMTKKELLALLFKLDREESYKSLIRKGEDGKEYLIQAVRTPEGGDAWFLDSPEQKKYDQWLIFEENTNCQ